MHWLGLNYTDGPYFQSQRIDIYKKHLETLQKNNTVYRCFCTNEELEKKRNRQIALKQPPRYDRTCTKLSEPTITKLLEQKKPFIWRMKLDQNKKITISDMSHGKITFDFSNFSDFPLTRQDDSFTFMFANFVDDMCMNITHVLRGEDHLSNTAGQVALYNAFGITPPLFWHMPILCNKQGKKMSKRDFGFSLQDLMDGGYLPEAIINYLALIGGSQFKSEILSLEEIIQEFDFDSLSSNSQVKYDVEKLNWINHKWIQRLSTEKLCLLTQSIIQKKFPEAKNITQNQLMAILDILKPSFTTLNDVIKEISFYFIRPKNISSELKTNSSTQTLIKLIDTPEFNLENLTSFKESLKKNNISIKEAFQFLRYALMGNKMGPSIAELIMILGIDEAQERLQRAVQSIKEKQ